MRIGTVDFGARIERERYFRELDYVELSTLFAGPQKASTLARLAESAPAGAIGLAAPYVLTHRKPPAGQKLWPHDASVGDFRDSAPGRAALAELRSACASVSASHVVFRSPETFSPSAANRDQLKRFFAEVAIDLPERVWVPGGLWEVRPAAKLAAELGVTLAFDPLVVEPGMPPEIHYDLEVTSLYLRIERPGPVRSERMEDLAALLEHYQELPVVVAFATPERWQDARNLKKMFAELAES
jgi:uncharacterized protein YecE (DUF72 family)